MLKEFACASLAVASWMCFADAAQADKLDDIVSSRVLRCGVMLDLPPGGYRDSSGNPAGFNVDTCHDIAKEMGVRAEIIETPGSQRIPALVTGNVDIVVASTTPTLQRALSVLFTDPYNITMLNVATRQDKPITNFVDLDGMTVAVYRGSAAEAKYLERCAAFAQGCKNISLATNAEVVTALRQGRADAMIESSSFLLPFVASSQGQDLRICCEVPNHTDWLSIAVQRGETDLRDWLNLYIFWRSESSRFDELYEKHYGAAAPSLKPALLR